MCLRLNGEGRQHDTTCAHCLRDADPFGPPLKRCRDCKQVASGLPARPQCSADAGFAAVQARSCGERCAELCRNTHNCEVLRAVAASLGLRGWVLASCAPALNASSASAADDDLEDVLTGMQCLVTACVLRWVQWPRCGTLCSIAPAPSFSRCAQTTPMQVRGTLPCHCVHLSADKLAQLESAEPAVDER